MSIPLPFQQEKGALHLTDKEFKRLNRAQLLDIIYQLQLQVDELTQKNQQLEKELEDKHLRINNAGSLAAAALEINGCFSNAQVAAEQYLNEIRTLRETTEAEQKRLHTQAKAHLSDAQAEAAQMVSDAQSEATRLLTEAQEKAASILQAANRAHSAYDAAVEMILREYEQEP